MSAHKLRLELSAHAQDDVDGILMYTTEYWGEKQTDKYEMLLQQAMNSIAADPLKGKKCDGFYSILAGKHRVFYRVEDGRIYVLRILHGRMDVARHLD